MIDSLEKLQGIMSEHGVERIYAKRLAPNDNSKNQIYLGGDFSVLNILPYKNIVIDDANLAGSVRDRAKAPLDFAWVTENGLFIAPNSQLILYPKYPEVRLSGFLMGCKNAPSNVMRVRDEGRLLFLGVTFDKRVLGFAIDRNHPIADEFFFKEPEFSEIGVFRVIPKTQIKNTRNALLARLSEIYQKCWIGSQKLTKDGKSEPYSARNGGGYTLEAELGISPNGYAEPDFLGWEIKQYSVKDFKAFRPKSPVTLFTPEPTGGFYKSDGVANFLSRFGYPDKGGKEDRVNFGGIYTCQKAPHADTGLSLALTGYDFNKGRIEDMNGGVALVTENGEVGALWGYAGLLEHWNKKHAQAAYVPSVFQSPPPEYAYGPIVELCEGTDFHLFLKAIAKGVVYYDPAIKMENASALKPKIKRRSQFRIKHQLLSEMYFKHEVISLEM